MSEEHQHTVHVVIGGTEKAGTTSLYQYLSASGLFSCSYRKETDYFRNTAEPSLSGYHQHFQKARMARPTRYLEASPGYLGDSEVVASRIFSVIPRCHLVFCLRNPIKRLQSSFFFSKSRFHIQKEVSFEEYVTACLQFESSGAPHRHISPWSLRALNSGLFYAHLSHYYDLFPQGAIQIFPFEDLLRDPKRVTLSVLRQLGVMSAFYDDYDFRASNVTFSPKNAAVQRVALMVNHRLEKFWRSHPSVKHSLLSIYRKVNARPSERTQLSPPIRDMLLAYYVDDLTRLRGAGWLAPEVVDNWLSEE